MWKDPTKGFGCLQLTHWLLTPHHVHLVQKIMSAWCKTICPPSAKNHVHLVQKKSCPPDAKKNAHILQKHVHMMLKIMSTLCKKNVHLIHPWTWLHHPPSSSSSLPSASKSSSPAHYAPSISSQTGEPSWSRQFSPHSPRWPSLLFSHRPPHLNNSKSMVRATWPGSAAFSFARVLSSTFAPPRVSTCTILCSPQPTLPTRSTQVCPGLSRYPETQVPGQARYTPVFEIGSTIGQVGGTKRHSRVSSPSCSPHPQRPIHLPWNPVLVEVLEKVWESTIHRQEEQHALSSFLRPTEEGHLLLSLPITLCSYLAMLKDGDGLTHLPPFVSICYMMAMVEPTSHPSTSASAKPACKLMLCQQRRHLGAKSNKIYYSCYYKNISFLHFVYILFSRHRYSPEGFCKAGRSTSRNFRFWYFRDVSTHINLSNGDALTSATFSALAKPSGVYCLVTPPGLPWHLLSCLCLLRLPYLIQTLPKTCNPQQSGWYHANVPILIQNLAIFHRHLSPSANLVVPGFADWAVSNKALKWSSPIRFTFITNFDDNDQW